jgi:hypothetical protein
MKREIEFLQQFADSTQVGSLEWMSSVGKTELHLVATNGIQLLRIPIDKGSNIIGLSDVSDKIKDSFFTQNCELSISASDIRDAVSQVPKKDVRVAKHCDECDGTGQVEWEYKHYNTLTADCPKCDGHGDVFTGEVLKDQPDYGDICFKVLNAYFNPKYFQGLLSACEFENTESISILSNNKSEANYFKVGRIDFIMMPLLSEEGFSKIININTFKP